MCVCERAHPPVILLKYVFDWLHTTMKDVRVSGHIHQFIIYFGLVAYSHGGCVCVCVCV